MRIILLAPIFMLNLSAGSALAAETFELGCPTMATQLNAVRPIPVEAESAAKVREKGWFLKANVKQPARPLWQKMYIFPPRYDGVMLFCETNILNVRFEAHIGLPRTKCKVDKDRMKFVCENY